MHGRGLAAASEDFVTPVVVNHSVLKKPSRFQFLLLFLSKTNLLVRVAISAMFAVIGPGVGRPDPHTSVEDGRSSWHFYPTPMGGCGANV